LELEDILAHGGGSGKRAANLSTAKNLGRVMNLQIALNPLCFMTACYVTVFIDY